MPDDQLSVGKSIADAYRGGTRSDTSPADRPAETGKSIADAYRAQSANAPPAMAQPDVPMLDDFGRPIDPAAATAAVAGAVGRVGKAAQEGYQGAPTVLTPEAQAALEKQGPYANLLDPFVHLANVGIGGLYGAGAGGAQAIIEAANAAGVPALGRDVNMFLQGLPIETAAMHPSLPTGNAEPYGPYGPRGPAQMGTERPLLAPPPEPQLGPSLLNPDVRARIAATPQDQPVPPGMSPVTTPTPFHPAPTEPPPITATGVPPPGTQGAPPAPAIPLPPPPDENYLAQATTAPSSKIAPIVTRAQAEAEADRIIQHFAAGGPTEINAAPLASGAQPTLSQSIVGGNAGLAGLERGVRDVPEQNQFFSARETANTQLRNKAVGDVIGDPRATDVTEADLNARTGPQEARIFDPDRTSPVDPSDAIAHIDQILQSGKGQRDVINKSLNDVRAKLVDKDGNMQTDPAQLRGIDQSIGDMISPKAAGTANDGRAAAHELMEVRDTLRGNIEQGAPGYQKFLADQAAERSAIDGQRFLQARNITDRQGNVNLGTLDSTIKAAERQQRMPGARLADGVTDEQLDSLKSLRADYQNDYKQGLGRSIGSPTVQKFGVSGAMGAMGHPLLAGALGTGGAYLAGVNPLLGTALGGVSYLMKEQSAKGQRMVMDALRDKLLNPDRARSALAPPTQ